MSRFGDWCEPHDRHTHTGCPTERLQTSKARERREAVAECGRFIRGGSELWRDTAGRRHGW